MGLKFPYHIKPAKPIKRDITNAKVRRNVLSNCDDGITVALKQPLISRLCDVNFLPEKRQTHLHPPHLQQVHAFSLSGC